MVYSLVLSFLLLLSSVAMGSSRSNNTPIGLWKTMDDKTGQAKAIIRIYEEEGVLKGKVERSFRDTIPGQPVLCVKCQGEQKNQPIKGLVFMWGMKPEKGEWSGGSILDPHSGKIYRAKMGLRENGNKLEVRGFIGISLLGRTQIWHRN